MTRLNTARAIALLSMLIVVPIGFWSKFYNGLGQEWFNNSLGGILYEIFWCLFFFFWIPHRKAVVQIPVWVFGITSLIEILQLWKTPILDAMRSTLIGRLFLGTTFVWSDFLYYVLGCLLGWLGLRQIWQFSQHEKERR
ncbi:DUF2809 domain-containing protein [Lusitaniella coriacea]|uniref:ribosomal maturation YjgA family protein n=1 Tax=Lusitaniella coriacea TaxID=1983105 RepID=UPI003CED860A